MSSKEEILARIRQHTRTRYEMPDLTLDAITYEDKVHSFVEQLKAGGGEAHLLRPDETWDEVIRSYYPDAKRIASNLQEIGCATFNPDELQDPRELNGTDLAVVKGLFGVAENAAVWLPKQTKHKAVFFISEALVILLDRRRLVNNMHEAYAQPGFDDFGYGCFIAGPSKTADIEQALVIGAHGARAVTVILE